MARRRSPSSSRSAPDVVLMDLRMPHLGGAAAIKALADRGADGQGARSHDASTPTRTSSPALEAGATGYLLKDAPRDELVRAIQAAARGESVLAPSVASTARQPAPVARAGRVE